MNDRLDRQAVAEQVAAAEVAAKKERVGVNGEDKKEEITAGDVLVDGGLELVCGSAGRGGVAVTAARRAARNEPSVPTGGGRLATRRACV